MLTLMLNTYFAQLSGVNVPRISLTGDSISNVVDFMLQLAAGIALIYIVIAAVRLTASSGDPQAVATGRKTIVFAMVGLIIAIMGLIITSIIQTEAVRIAGAGDPFFGEGGVITVVVEKLSFAVGVAAVIMLIIGGIRYITSAGQPNSAEAARNTIIYAIVGIVVAIIAQLLISFVLIRIGGA